MQRGKWYKFDTTTAKLADHLNHIEESGDTVVLIRHVGGRDWVILCRAGQNLRGGL